MGDAFGERYFGPEDVARARIAARELADAPWRYTDDTAMALSLIEVLEERGHVDRDRLARSFAARWSREPSRGYGGGAHVLLHRLCLGRDWREESAALFAGGSFGNGGAMRAAPLGAYFADADDDTIVREASASAEVTHAHAEGRAGAIAVALAAAHVAREGARARRSLLAFVAERLAPGETRARIVEAGALGLDTSIALAASRLGTGQRVSAMDTVPFSLWCAARHLDDFAEAMWTTVAGLGDRDTTCAIVGGIVASQAHATVPPRWLEAREALPPGFEP